MNIAALPASLSVASTRYTFSPTLAPGCFKPKGYIFTWLIGYSA